MRNPLCPRSVACSRPKMSNFNGRTWDICKVILTNGKEIEGQLDTSWGHWFYFQIDGKWRKAKIDSVEESCVGFTNKFTFKS